MSLFDIVAILLTLAAVFSLLNYKTIKLPNGIGIMVIGLLMSIGLIVLHKIGWFSTEAIQQVFKTIDFNQAVLNGMLSFLLFAGALHVNINKLAELADTIAILATIGVAISAGIVSVATFYIFMWLGIDISYMYCLLFGVLISPTDPIAVMGILKKIGAPKSIEVKITGESLFNDGVAVVFFIVVLELAVDPGSASFKNISLLFIQEAVGGAVYGFIIGYVAYRMLKAVDDYHAVSYTHLTLPTNREV